MKGASEIVSIPFMVPMISMTLSSITAVIPSAFLTTSTTASDRTVSIINITTYNTMVDSSASLTLIIAATTMMDPGSTALAPVTPTIVTFKYTPFSYIHTAKETTAGAFTFLPSVETTASTTPSFYTTARTSPSASTSPLFYTTASTSPSFTVSSLFTMETSILSSITATNPFRGVTTSVPDLTPPTGEMRIIFAGVTLMLSCRTRYSKIENCNNCWCMCCWRSHDCLCYSHHLSKNVWCLVYNAVPYSTGNIGFTEGTDEGDCHSPNQNQWDLTHLVMETGKHLIEMEHGMIIIIVSSLFCWYMSITKMALYTLASVKSCIPVAEFSDYVLEMTVEDDYNNSSLARQFAVEYFSFFILKVVVTFCIYREFQVHQHQPTLRHVSHTMWCRIGLGTSIHVKSLTCFYAISCTHLLLCCR